MKKFRICISLLFVLFTLGNIIEAQPLNLVKKNRQIQTETVTEKIENNNEIVEEETATLSETEEVAKTENEISNSNSQNMLAYRREFTKEIRYLYCIFYEDEKLFKEFDEGENGGCYYGRYYGDLNNGVDVVYFDGEEKWHSVFKNAKDGNNNTIIEYAEYGAKNTFTKCNIDEALNALKKAGDNNIIELLDYNEEDRKNSPVFIADRISGKDILEQMSVEESKVSIAFHLYGQLEYPNGFKKANLNDKTIIEPIDSNGTYKIKEQVEIVDSNGIAKICTAEAIVNIVNKIAKDFKVY